MAIRNLNDKNNQNMSVIDDPHSLKFYSSIALRYDELMLQDDENSHVRAAFLRIVASNHRPGDTILDFGCGTGIDAIWYSNNNYSIIAYEPSPGMYTELVKKIASCDNKNKIKPLTGEIEMLNEYVERYGKVSSIVANFGVLNHIHDLEELFRNFTQWIKPGGHIVVSVNNPTKLGHLRQLWWWKGIFSSLITGYLKITGNQNITYKHYSSRIIKSASQLSFVEKIGVDGQGNERYGFFDIWSKFIILNFRMPAGLDSYFRKR